MVEALCVQLPIHKLAHLLVVQFVAVYELVGSVFLQRSDLGVVLLAIEFGVFQLLAVPLTVLQVRAVEVVLALAQVELPLLVTFQAIVEFLHEHSLHGVLVVLCGGVARVNLSNRLFALLSSSIPVVHAVVEHPRMMVLGFVQDLGVLVGGSRVSKHLLLIATKEDFRRMI